MKQALLKNRPLKYPVKLNVPDLGRRALKLAGKRATLVLAIIMPRPSACCDRSSPLTGSQLAPAQTRHYPRWPPRLPGKFLGQTSSGLTILKCHEPVESCVVFTSRLIFGEGRDATSERKASGLFEAESSQATGGVVSARLRIGGKGAESDDSVVGRREGFEKVSGTKS